MDTNPNRTKYDMDRPTKMPTWLPVHSCVMLHSICSLKWDAKCKGVHLKWAKSMKKNHWRFFQMIFKRTRYVNSLYLSLPLPSYSEDNGIALWHFFVCHDNWTAQNNKENWTIYFRSMAGQRRKYHNKYGRKSLRMSPEFGKWGNASEMRQTKGVNSLLCDYCMHFECIFHFLFCVCMCVCTFTFHHSALLAA